MANIPLTRPIQDSRALRLRGEPTVSRSEGLGTRFDIPSFSQELLTAMEIQAQETGVLGGVPPSVLRLGSDDGLGGVETETPEALNKRYEGIGLKFDQPMSKEGARLLAEGRRAELIRNSVLRREPSGITQFSVGLGVSLLNAAMDPLEIGAALIPIVGQAKQAAWIARFGTVRGRAAVGFVEGTVGNILTEPGYMALSVALQRDYTMSDALINVFIGGVLGTTLGVGIGAGSRVRERLRLRGVEIETPAAPRGEGPRLLPAPERIEAGPTTRAVQEPTPRELELTDILRRRENRKVTVRKQIAEVQAKIGKAKNIGQRTKLERQLGRLDLELTTIGTDNLATRSEIRRLQEARGVASVPSTEARGQALKHAVAQAAQGKQVQVQRTVRAIEDKRGVQALQGRTQELNRQIKFTENILRRAKQPDVIKRHTDNLAAMRREAASLEQQLNVRQQAVARRVHDEAKRVAADEQRPERSVMYEPEAVSRLQEEAKKPDVPDDAEVTETLADIQRQLEQEVEAGRLSQEEFDGLKADLAKVDEQVVAMERASDFMRACLRR